MTELVADAQPSQKNISSLIQDLNFDLEVLKNIERDLEDHEQLTLLFLILQDFDCFDEVYEAFCEQPVENLLSKFIDQIPDWQTRLLEALCVTNARKQIRLLGLSYEELERIYVPKLITTNPKFSSRAGIHPGARLLFELFDNVLDCKQRDTLREKIHSEILAPQLKARVPLEIHALYWMRKGYISLSPDGRGDLKNLLKPLKTLQLSDHQTYLDLENYSVSPQEKSLPTTRQVPSPTPTHPQNSSDRPAVKNLIQSAYVIILNVITIPGGLYEDRVSSRVDASRLKDAFRGLGYTVSTFTDPTSLDVKNIFRYLKTDFDKTKHDGLIVCILSHGIEGHFVSHDGQDVSLDSIEQLICIPHLQLIPKIVLVQACRGDNIGQATRQDLVADGPTGTGRNRFINTIDHDRFVRFTATIRKCKAIRHRENGSWFINAVCDALREPRDGNSPLSINKWTKRVNYFVKMNEGELEEGVMAAQLPEVTERFSEDFHFPVFRAELSREGN